MDMFPVGHHTAVSVLLVLYIFFLRQYSTCVCCVHVSLSLKSVTSDLLVDYSLLHLHAYMLGMHAWLVMVCISAQVSSAQLL